MSEEIIIIIIIINLRTAAFEAYCSNFRHARAPSGGR